MSSAARPAPRFRVGDWVSFPYGPSKVLAEVVEDRGLLGTQGRRLYRVRPDLGQAEATTFEVLDEDLEAAPAPEAANPLLDAVLDFLHQGKQFTRISPEKYARSRREVTFTFSDGTEAVRPFECDHPTFLGWWKQTSGYLRRVADAFGTPGSAGGPDNLLSGSRSDERHQG